MGTKEDGLEAFVKAKKKKKTKGASKSGIEEIAKSAVHSRADNPTFNKVSLTQADGPLLKKGRVNENPDVFHPENPEPHPQQAMPKRAPTARQAKALRNDIAASTTPCPEIDQTMARKLVLNCHQLVEQFQEVARTFQGAAGGRRDGPVYEAWRDLNHAQILLYRSMSVIREGYNLDEE